MRPHKYYDAKKYDKHLYLFCSVDPVAVPVQSISTISDSIGRNPRAFFIIPSLSLDSSDFEYLIKLNLNPLIIVTRFWRPIWTRSGYIAITDRDINVLW